MKKLIENYKPTCMQEEKDKEVILKYLNTFDDCLTRENVFGHFTSSAFIINKDHTKVLMAYHNIYKSYAWLGGHLDGDCDSLRVAIKEAYEESCIKNLNLLNDEIISLDVIEVCGHKKKGVWIYACEADGTPYDKTDFKGPIAIILGSEGFGISRLLKEKSDFIVSLPMRGKVNSLNVSCAGAVILYEAVKHR